MKEETVREAERITKELERYVAEDNRTFVLGVLLRALETKEKPPVDGLLIDLPALRSALATLRKSRLLIMSALADYVDKPEAVEDVIGALVEIIDNDWRPLG